MLAALLNVVSSAKPEIDVKKLTKSAQQFEALLLNTLLRPLEGALAGLPGTTNQPGSDAYSSLGTEALASGLVAKGGLGIAQMIVAKVMKNHQVAASQPAEIPAKDFSQSSR
jgi:Rod binding domain-containing protein